MIGFIFKKFKSRPLTEKNKIEELIDFYENTADDYLVWSKNRHMHYGYLERWTDFFHREKMLESMTHKVFKELDCDEGNIYDLGCGAGASVLYLAEKYKDCKFTGISIVPGQIEISDKRKTVAGITNARFLIGDYRFVNVESGSCNGIYGIESSCYATGNDKSDLLSEIFRMLQPGSKMVVADCFLKIPGEKLNWFERVIYDSFCRCWKLPELAFSDSFINRMKLTGFTRITVTDISWRVAPSVLYTPFLILKFLFIKLFAGNLVKKQSLDNLKASLLTIALGLNRKKFSYFIISATKPLV
jgi:cyclopropane fatty-acyl-phospholipid synthase-like methyltransferase